MRPEEAKAAAAQLNKQALAWMRSLTPAQMHALLDYAEEARAYRTVAKDMRHTFRGPMEDYYRAYPHLSQVAGHLRYLGQGAARHVARPGWKQIPCNPLRYALAWVSARLRRLSLPIHPRSRLGAHQPAPPPARPLKTPSAIEADACSIPGECRLPDEKP